MKYHYIGLLMCGLPLSSMAQVTLTEAANAPNLDSEFTVQRLTTYTAPGTSGSGQSWDFSMLDGGTVHVIHVEDPMAVAGTHLIRDDVDSMYYEVDANGMYLVKEETMMTAPGVGTEAITVDYTGEGVRTLAFPASFGDEWQGIVNGSYVLQNEPFIRTGTIDGAVDADGMIEMPDGSYDGVLRVHTWQNTTETGVISGFNVTADRVSHTWAFYADWLKHPLLKITADTISVTSPLPTSIPTVRTEWLDTVSVGIIEAIENNAAFGVWPTPASDVLNITLPVLQQGKVQGILRDLTGRIVREWNVASIGNTSVNVSDLPQGQYFLQLIGNSGEVGVRKVIVR